MDSYFEKGIKLTGTLWVKGNVHFDADIEGQVYSSDHFIVGQSGHVKGDIRSVNFSNMGEVIGNIFTENKVALLKDSKLTGDISTYHLVIDEGSNFEGRCKMIDAPPEVKAEEPAKSSKKSSAKPKIQTGTTDQSQSSGSWLKKISMFGVAGLVLTGIFVFPKYSETGLEEQVEAGYRLIRENRYGDAEAEFKKALEQTRNDPQVYAGLGEVFLNKKRYNEAVSQFKLSIELKPSNSGYRVKLATAYHAQGQLKEAESSYRSAIETGPQNAEAYYLFGTFMEEKGDQSEELGVDVVNTRG